MFQPPRCPKPACDAHAHPENYPDGFYQHNGSYHPKCRSRPVPRFKCKACKRGFSRQTFRVDYCDNKPHLNAALFRLLASGMGLRQSGRILPLSRRCVELKARKISRHLGKLNRNLTFALPNDARMTLDEMETFEGERAVLPVTVPILVETRSMFIFATEVTSIKPSGTMTPERKLAIARAEARRGKRQDFSRNAIGRIFWRLKIWRENNTPFRLVSDRKQLYASTLRRFFGPDIPHRTISSKERRDQNNPLAPINLTNAMARDLNGRLRRESWLVSKARRFLRLQLFLFCAYRNFIRRRINRKPETPAQELGFLPRAMKFEELLTWRQDWHRNSIHPIAEGSESVAQFRRRTSG